ncbi:NAD(P)/FAD-dependent oxidoreductase [Flavobacterium sp. RHBU_24]|uniref:NAD(P)/FAD-dependent oxidoreductase n=1 Tax=Flavobacterium sp. RHBU_24 TaxID=3391185 RepID=UPI003984AAB1
MQREESTPKYDVIIIGGSYAGLSAAMALGRSLRKVLIIDSGNPCNKKAPHAHNFITNDGRPPVELTRISREQVQAYPTVNFIEGLAEDVIPYEKSFEVTANGTTYTSRKILFATGVTDLIPNIPGFDECWGISILHCPYCHGFEHKRLKTAVIGNGDMGYELAKVIRNWTDELTLYTNGTSTLSPEEVLKLNSHGILVIENEITDIAQNDGNIVSINFKDTLPETPEVIYTQLPFRQQCSIPEKLGLEMTEKGFILVNKCKETSIPGIFAAGDCLSLFRSVANAVASGNKAGALINKCLIDEDF